jgi:hypothetical protein
MLQASISYKLKLVGWILLDKSAKIPNGELEKVAAPFATPLCHDLRIVGKLQQFGGIVNNANFDKVISHDKGVGKLLVFTNSALTEIGVKMRPLVTAFMAFRPRIM